MEGFSRLGQLSWRLKTLFIVIPLLLMLGFPIFLHSLNRLHTSQQVAHSTRDLMLDLERLLALMRTAETHQRVFLMTGQNSPLNAYGKAAIEVDELLGRLREKSVGRPRQLAMLDAIINEWRMKRRELERTVQIRKQRGFEASRRQLIANAGQREMENLRFYISSVMDKERRVLARQEEEERTVEWILSVSLFGFTGIALMLLMLAHFLWRRDRLHQAAATRRLAESEARMRVVMNNAPVILWSVDLAGNFIVLEGKGLELAGHREDPAGNYFEKYRHEPQMTEPLVRALAGETVRIDLSTAGRWYEAVFIPVHEGDGPVTGVVGLFVDVSVRKLREQEAEQANRAKSRFLANMSHEIRTPLGIIRGFSEVAMNADLSHEDQTRYLGKIKHHADILAKLVDDILDLSKVEADRLEIERMEVELPELLDELQETFQLKARERSLQFQVEMARDVPEWIISDPTRLRQVLMNLLGNAFKFTSQGSVVLFVRSLGQTGNCCRMEFRVRDTGAGIPLPQQSRLFQPFSQADSSTTRFYGGTGLGLVLSKKLAEALGGTLELAWTEPDKGSEFVFSASFNLPTVNLSRGVSRPEAEKAELAARSEILKGVKVLLVEDALDNQLLVRIYLEAHGAQLTMADDGPSGVKKAREGDFDVILMDIQMPGMDGFEAMRTLRQAGDHRPIVALTAHALKEERLEALRSGFDDYMTKPIDRVELVRKVEMHARRRTRDPDQREAFFSR
ncbi:MAG: response regulator [Bdellovibrionaceae bacterium]|nr:response regulator [Pseudobdellovibrionaceae bacterium]